MTAAEALEELATLQAENLALRMENTDLRGCRERQAETIKCLWVRETAKDKRIETLQGMVDWQRTRIDELEAAQTPHAKAERAFKT